MTLAVPVLSVLRTPESVCTLPAMIFTQTLPALFAVTLIVYVFPESGTMLLHVPRVTITSSQINEAT